MRIVLAICLLTLSACFVFADDDRIWLENTKIDGKPVRMFFDSGSSSIFLTSQAVKRLGLNIVTPPTNGFGDTADYSGEIEGVPVRTDFAIVHFGGNMIPDFDGLIGWGPVHSNIFRIDADVQKLLPLPVVPAGLKRWTQLSIDTNSGTLDLEIPDKRRGHNIVTVDTGAPCGIELTTREWNRWKRTHPHKPTTLSAISTADGVYVCEESWADEIQVGPLIFYDVPVMEEGPSARTEFGSERDVLGFDALRHLDVVADGIHGIAYIRVKQTPLRPYSYNRLGAGFVPTARDAKDLIAQVVTGSPAYEAGIRNGDILLKIDGQSVSGWTNGWKESDPDTFSKPAGTKVRLTLRRDKKIFETTAVLREILQPSDRKYKSVDEFPGKSELDAETYVDEAFECECHGDSNGALTNYDKAIESDPDFGDAYGRRARLEQSNNPGAALADYSKAINLGAGTADYYAYRGALEQRKSQFDAAIADYEKTMQLKATLPGIETNLAQIYSYRGYREMRSNQLNAALADFNKAVKLEPDLADAYADRGFVEQQKTNFEAIADFEKALELKPDLTWIRPYLAGSYGYRGSLEQQTNEFDAALADFNKAIELEPHLAQAYADRGYLEQETNELEAAIADYEKALQIEPDLTWIKPNLAGIYGYRGSLEQRTNGIDAALADYSKAIELDPTDDYSHFDVWLCNSSLGNLERANKDLKAYLSTRGSKDSGDWPSEVGRFLVGQITDQDFLSAAKSADTKKNNEQHCEAYFYIGAKRLFDGDKTGAVAEFQKCLGTDVQSFNEYQFAKAELQMLKAGD